MMMIQIGNVTAPIDKDKLWSLFRFLLAVSTTKIEFIPINPKQEG